MAATEDVETVAQPATSVRAALAVLQADQRALVRDVEHARYDDEYHLRGGFPDRRAVIKWFQRAIVRTFGHVCDVVDIRSLKFSHNLMVNFITGERRRRYASAPPSLEEARLYRERFEAQALSPARTAAFRDLRGRAGEYTGQDRDLHWSDIEVAEQPHLAMRPGFSQLDRQQAAALDDLWGGFEDREELYEWIDDLDAPTNGAIRSDLLPLVDNAREGRRKLLADYPDPDHARQIRELFAIEFLLPAFVEGVRELDAAELVTQPRRGLEVSQG